MKRLAALGGVVTLTAHVASAGVVDQGLRDVLEESPPDKVISTLVYLSDRVDTDAITDEMDLRHARLAERHEVVVRELRALAAQTQGPLLAHLAQLKDAGRIMDFEAYWISNIIRVDAVRGEIDALARRDDVDLVFYNFGIGTITPVGPPRYDDPDGPITVGAVEPGVVAVRAPEVWQLGIDGTGVLVSTLDTGVDGNHPALASRWRGLDPAYAGNPGWAFFDPVTGWTFPQDSAIHGTHTMGSVCGGPPGDQIGVAPGAEWIQAAVIDRVSISQTVSDSLLAFQWVIDPDGNAGTSFDVPAVCSNSWGLTSSHGYPNCDQTFWAPLDAVEAAGIVVLFSAGNEGFSGLRRPADRATDEYRTVAVAAVNANVGGWPISSFSSRGPTFCTPGGGAAIKPDISAPGEDVRSSLPGASYGLLSGTSMASPHVNGVVALMRQANPDLAVEQIKQIIYDTAVDLGPAGEDNDYGYGMIDAYEAVQLALGSANLSFSFPNGQPQFIEPAGGTTIRVVVSGTATQPDPGTGILYYSTDGGSYSQVAMTQVNPNEYDAVFPSFGCGDAVWYYFSADTTEGDTVANPFSAPTSSYTADAYSGISLAFDDDFEADQGWTVSNGPLLTTGAWERGVPAGFGDRGDPAADADGSGQCYVTELADGDFDIDGDVTILTSPDMDATDPESVLSYYRWYSNTFGSDPENDIFVVDVSDDGGSSWVNLETVGPSGPEVNGGWFHKEFLVSAISGIANTSQLAVRFTAGDLGSPSVVEAGVDGVQISVLYCDLAAPCADTDGNTTVNVDDLLAVMAAWGQIGVPEDFLPPPGVGVDEFLEVLAQWGTTCP